MKKKGGKFENFEKKWAGDLKFGKKGGNFENLKKYWAGNLKFFFEK